MLACCQSCEHGSLKTNESILMEIDGVSGDEKDVKCQSHTTLKLELEV